MTKLLLACFCFFSIFVTPSVTNGQETHLRIVYTKWFPYTFEKNHNPSGFEIDILKAVLGKMNLTATFGLYPWPRCLKYLEQGKADAVISMLYTPEREQYTYYPDEYISISKTMLFKKAKSHITFNGAYEGLKRYTIGVIMGFSYGNDFDRAEYLQKDNAIDAKMLISKLLGNRNDLIAENQAVIAATALQMGVKDRIQSLEPPIHTQKLYVGFSKDRGLKKICHDFSIALREFKKTEHYKAILEKYGIMPSDMMETIK